jgi:hypothetical protein
VLNGVVHKKKDMQKTKEGELLMPVKGRSPKTSFTWSICNLPCKINTGTHPLGVVPGHWEVKSLIDG